MDEFYFFWNAFNLTAILIALLGVGLLLGAVLSGIISLLIQIEDPAISFFGKLSGFMIGAYIFAPLILSSFKDFALIIWGETSTYQ